MRQLLRLCADAPHSLSGVQAGGASAARPEQRTATVLPLAMTALFIWGVILPLEIAAHLLGSS
jgi:hypothetical protein